MVSIEGRRALALTAGSSDCRWQAKAKAKLSQSESQSWKAIFFGKPFCLFSNLLSDIPNPIPIPSIEPPVNKLKKKTIKTQKQAKKKQTNKYTNAKTDKKRTKKHTNKNWRCYSRSLCSRMKILPHIRTSEHILNVIDGSASSTTKKLCWPCASLLLQAVLAFQRPCTRWWWWQL